MKKFYTTNNFYNSNNNKAGMGDFTSVEIDKTKPDTTDLSTADIFKPPVPFQEEDLDEAVLNEKQVNFILEQRAHALKNLNSNLRRI
jgi:hypothetical protein